jgi:hypothetical protein
MAGRAKARREKRAAEEAERDWAAIPVVLAGELPAGEPDTARWWCTSCGLPDAPVAGKLNPEAPCPRCGSPWRWHGRLADRDGTAEGPPDGGTCLSCYDWRRYPGGQRHFGWAWWRTCAHGCPCAHHADEVWLA